MCKRVGRSGGADTDAFDPFCCVTMPLTCLPGAPRRSEHNGRLHQEDVEQSERYGLDAGLWRERTPKAKLDEIQTFRLG